MRQEPFKNLYQQIHLTEQQKDMLWQRIMTAPQHASRNKKAVLPARVAACFAILLLSGMTVFAANELSLMDKIADAVNLLTQNKDELSDAQKNLYAEYGQTLDIAIELDNGTLMLDAALCDESHLLIPFRYAFHADVEKCEAFTAGAELDHPSLRQLQIRYKLDTDTFLRQFEFCIEQDTRHPNLSRYLMTNPVIAEDQTISGSFLLSAEEYQYFAQGNVIQLVRIVTEADAGQDTINAKDTAAGSTNDTLLNVAMNNTELCAEFTLEKTLEQHALTISAENAKALEDMGLSVEHMTISPLSLCYSGKGRHTRALSSSITIVLKDGSIVENSPTGSGYSLRSANRDNTDFTFFASRIFAVPVLIEDIAEIHIQNSHGADIHIPVQIE